jgi:hypothetical protein
MLAYEFLKDNPAANSRLIQQGWQELFNDPEVPYGVKQELVELEQGGIPLTDPMLYFHGIYILDRMLHSPDTKTTRNRYPYTVQRCVDVLRADRWINAMYSWVQSYPDEKDKIERLFFVMLNADMIPNDLPVKNIKDIIVMGINPDGSELQLQRAIVKALRPDETYNSDIWRLYSYMSYDFIAGAELSTINRAFQLIRDVPKPADTKYKSYKELERAHDLATAREVERLLEEKPRGLKYHPTLVELVTKHGFILPKTKNDMIKRGAAHHNCVATYADRHCNNSYSTLCRLIFSTEATAELTIYIEHDMIVAVMVPQYKGRYNKDVERPKSLSELRIALTGQHKSIVGVYYDQD